MRRKEINKVWLVPVTKFDRRTKERSTKISNKTWLYYSLIIRGSVNKKQSNPNDYSNIREITN